MDLNLTKKDFRIDWFSGTGGGGQYRNKHQNCCRITHIESGLVATGQSNRERPANQKEAFTRLVSKLLAFYAEPESERRSGNLVVRTYDFEDSVVEDGAVRKQPKGVMDGDLNDFIQTALMGQRPKRYTGRM